MITGASDRGLGGIALLLAAANPAEIILLGRLEDPSHKGDQRNQPLYHYSIC